MSSASTDIISNNQLKDKTQGQESRSPQDTILDKASHNDAKDDVNIGADFWYHKIGANIIPDVSKYNVSNVARWKEWQNTPVTEEQFNNWKRNGRFNQGMAVIDSQIWCGLHKGKHLVCVDCDNQTGVDDNTMIITVDIMKEILMNNQAIENLTALKDVGTELGFTYVNKNVKARKKMRMLEGKRKVFLGLINAEMT